MACPLYYNGGWKNEKNTCRFGGVLLPRILCGPRRRRRSGRNGGEDLPDAVVQDAIEELEETDEFRFEKRTLYDLALEETGFLYDIEIGDRRGFLVLLETESGYEVAEYYVDAENPYKDARRPVYGGFLNYLRNHRQFLLRRGDGKTRGEAVRRLQRFRRQSDAKNRIFEKVGSFL